MKKLIVIASMLCAALGVSAQEELHGSLDEVTVTALKGGASQAGSVTNVGSQEAERLNVLTMKGVSEIAPNFYIPDYGTRMTSSIYVRGIGARIDQPVVGLVVDNVCFLNKDNYDFDLADIASIEVMRGPQNTLFGRNTMGGMVNIRTLSPLTWQGVRVMAEGGSGALFRGAVSGYALLRPDLGMSLTVTGNYLGGFFTNENSGAKADREEGGSVRWKTVWRPSSALMVENNAAVTVNRQHGYPYRNAQTGVIAYGDTCFYRRTGVTDGLTVRWRLPSGLTLSSMTSFQYLHDNMTLDQDFRTDDYFTLTQARHEWAFTEDIVAKGERGDYKWLGGLFGFTRRSRMRAPVTFLETGIAELIAGHRNEMNPAYPITWDSDEFLLDSRFLTRTSGAALYHRSEYSVGPVTLSAGLRLDLEHIGMDYRSMCDATYTIWNGTAEPPEVFRNMTLAIDDPGHLGKTRLELLPAFSVTYAPDRRWRLYASVAKGYKSGGYNTQMFSDVLQQRVMETMGVTAKYDVEDIVGYDPERSWNYELGAAFDGGRLLRAEGALFYIDCRDQQLTTFPDGTTTGRIMTNAGKTRSMGAELSLRSNPWRTLSLQAAWGFTDARFVEYFNGRERFDDKRVPYAPCNTLFVGAAYTFRLPGGITLEPSVDVRGVGDIYWDEANTSRQTFYALLGAQAVLSAPTWSLTLWGENLTGTRYDTFSYISVGQTFFQQGKPARCGATLRLNFETNQNHR